MSDTQANARSFDLQRHLLTTRSTGRVADVARCLHSQERILPITLEADAAEVAARVARKAPLHVQLQAIAGIWMPTKRAFVQLPSGSGAIGVFAEVQPDGAVDVFRLESDGVKVRDVPFTSHVRPADPRPKLDWDEVRAGRWGARDHERWATWGRRCLRVTCHDRRLKGPAVQRWAQQLFLADLVVLAMALSFLGWRTIEATRPDGSVIPMDGGHAA